MKVQANALVKASLVSAREKAFRHTPPLRSQRCRFNEEDQASMALRVVEWWRRSLSGALPCVGRGIPVGGPLNLTLLKGGFVMNGDGWWVNGERGRWSNSLIPRGSTWGEYEERRARWGWLAHETERTGTRFLF
jgi:hypothetical protein